MRTFQEFCYLIVQRNLANKKRKRLLYRLNKLREQYRSTKTYSRNIKILQQKLAYRMFAEGMRKIAKEEFSVLRRQLSVRCNYDANNKIVSIFYGGQEYSLNHIENYANSYMFEKIVLSEGEINNPYKVLE